MIKYQVHISVFGISSQLNLTETLQPRYSYSHFADKEIERWSHGW